MCLSLNTSCRSVKSSNVGFFLFPFCLLTLFFYARRIKEQRPTRKEEKRKLEKKPYGSSDSISIKCI